MLRIKNTKNISKKNKSLEMLNNYDDDNYDNDYNDDDDTKMLMMMFCGTFHVIVVILYGRVENAWFFFSPHHQHSRAVWCGVCVCVFNMCNVDLDWSCQPILLRLF